MRQKLTSTLVIILTATVLVFAQDSSKAKQILDKVSKQYKQYKTLEVSYSIINKTKSEKPKVTRENGTVYIKGEKYMMSSKDKDVYCNGDTVWTNDKVFGECTIENYDAAKQELTPAKIFTLHEKGFLYKLNGEEIINNKKNYQVDLTPKDKKKPYYKVRVSVIKDKSHISRLIMMLRSSEVSISVNNQKENVTIADDKFRFDPKAAGIPVVDLTTKK